MAVKTRTQSAILRNLERDQNHVAVQVAQSFQTQDAATVAVTSPVSYTGDVQTITVPDRAVVFHIRPTTNLRVSELSTAARYHFVDASVEYVFPCANLDLIYITRDSANGTAYFYFEIV